METRVHKLLAWEVENRAVREFDSKKMWKWKMNLPPKKLYPPATRPISFETDLALLECSARLFRP